MTVENEDPQGPLEKRITVDYIFKAHAPFSISYPDSNWNQVEEEFLPREHEVMEFMIINRSMTYTITADTLGHNVVCMIAGNYEVANFGLSVNIFANGENVANYDLNTSSFRNSDGISGCGSLRLKY